MVPAARDGKEEEGEAETLDQNGEFKGTTHEVKERQCGEKLWQEEEEGEGVPLIEHYLSLRHVR